MGRRLAILAILLAALLAAAGCLGHSSPTAPAAPRSAAPAPDTPAHAVAAMTWAWDHRDTLVVCELLADDFAFAFAVNDSAGDAFPGRVLDREAFLRCVGDLFVAGGGPPPARRIALDVDGNLYAVPDSRPGKTSPWHKEVWTRLDLTVDLGTQVYRVTGYARFFLVRGDSAAIPADLAARGFGSDSTRWYFDRWEDETGSAAGALVAPVVRPAEPQPTRPVTLGSILALYW